MSDEEPSGGRVRVFVYADYVCPFSYLASARLDRLREERDLVDFWRPFAVHAAVPRDGLPVEQAGYAPDEWSRVRREVETMARELELPLEMPDFVANSHEALQAAEFAKDLGRESFRSVHRSLFRAYFVEGRNLGRREVVLAAAGDAGVDVEALEAALEDERYEEELRRAREEADRYEITGTPTFLFGRHKVVGAAPLEVLREAADRAESGDG